ncbi:MAG: HAMP domain-containing sensor histidine kinase [Hyphomicrobiales bacterium]|nr:HAMP domain-containing sensor histidine kinase [Hyphomicrobiales bacterium]
MNRILNPPSWPTTVKAPLLVALLMFLLSVAISNRVLLRLAETQERHLGTLSGAYLDGLSSSILPHVLREDVWEVFDALDRSRTLYSGVDAVETVAVNSTGSIIAASNPAAFPTGMKPPDGWLMRFSDNNQILIDERNQRAFVHRALTVQGQNAGAIFTELDISTLLLEREAVLWTLVVTNSALTLLLTAAGYLAMRFVVTPIKTLDAYPNRSADGPIELIPPERLGSSSSEFGRLFRRYNAMARAANERLALTERLAEEEKLASLGRLASGMAHEINNPLGGMFNALDAIERYGERESVRATSVRLLKQGLRGIRDVVRATLVTYRAEETPRPLTPQDIDDLRLLIKPELQRKELAIDWQNRVDVALPVAAMPIRQAALNILLNACAAAPKGSKLSFKANTCSNRLTFVITDRGAGLPKDLARCLETSGGVSPIPSKKGLGLWMVRRLLDETGGDIEVNWPPQGGTTVRLNFRMTQGALRDVA